MQTRVSPSGSKTKQPHTSQPEDDSRHPAASQALVGNSSPKGTVQSTPTPAPVVAKEPRGAEIPSQVPCIFMLSPDRHTHRGPVSAEFVQPWFLHRPHLRLGKRLRLTSLLQAGLPRPNHRAQRFPRRPRCPAYPQGAYSQMAPHAPSGRGRTQEEKPGASLCSQELCLKIVLQAQVQGEERSAWEPRAGGGPGQGADGDSG